MLAHGGTEADFRELVTARDIVLSEGGWWATSERALEVSSVEADARLARWTRRTGQLGVRLSRTDDARWWLAVHHGGERLMAMVHCWAPDTTGGAGLAGAAELGQDPLVAARIAEGRSPTEARLEAADRRADELSRALSAGDVEAKVEPLRELLLTGRAPDGGLRGLLALLGIPSAGDLLDEESPLVPGQGSVREVVGTSSGRAALMGCAIPAVAGAVVFVAVSRMAVRMWPPLFALLAGFAAAWATILLVARVTRPAPRQGDRWQRRFMLSWAAENPGEVPVKPDPDAMATWGGIFYLLRDIAFFAGIDRPQGPIALYAEAWSIGPPRLVAAINRVAGGRTSPDPLFDAAHELVALRSELIDAHLGGLPVVADQVAERVRTILRPAVQLAESGLVTES